MAEFSLSSCGGKRVGLLMRPLILLIRATPSWPNFLPKVLAPNISGCGLYFSIWFGRGGGHKPSIHYKCEHCTLDMHPSMSFNWPVLLKAFSVLFHLSKMRNTCILYPRKCWTIWNTWFSFILKNWPIHFLAHIFLVSPICVQLWHTNNITC